FAVSRPEPEEGGAIPAGGGNHPRDLRQAAVVLASIGEPVRHDGNEMGFTAPRPFQDRAGAEAIGRGGRSHRFATPDRRCQPLQLALDGWSKATELPGLQVPGNGVDDKLAARALNWGLADDPNPNVEQVGPRHTG